MLAGALDVLGLGLIAVGLALATVALFGLLRMPDVYAQLHPAGLVTGPAVMAVLLAAVATGNAEIITSAVLIVLFVLITAPLSSHAIARARRGQEAREAEAKRR
jgi:multicomponent Na+:H+ antiporter subunit G